MSPVRQRASRISSDHYYRGLLVPYGGEAPTIRVSRIMLSGALARTDEWYLVLVQDMQRVRGPSQRLSAPPTQALQHIVSHLYHCTLDYVLMASPARSTVPSPGAGKSVQASCRRTTRSST